jgi:hypothetical protein
VAIGCSILVCAACGGESNADRVEAQVAGRFGASAHAECASGGDDRSWLCDVFVETEQRHHEGCRAWVNADMSVVRFESC